MRQMLIHFRIIFRGEYNNSVIIITARAVIIGFLGMIAKLMIFAFHIELNFLHVFRVFL